MIATGKEHGAGLDQGGVLDAEVIGSGEGLEVPLPGFSVVGQFDGDVGMVVPDSCLMPGTSTHPYDEIPALAIFACSSSGQDSVGR